MSGFSFASPTPATGATTATPGTGGGFSFGTTPSSTTAGTGTSAAAAAPAPATTPGPVQPPTAAAATNTATKGVSFSFASPGPTFGATPASTAGGFASPPASAASTTTAGAGATPVGVANPLLRNAGVTPGLSRGGGGGMSGASPASFLSPGIGGGTNAIGGGTASGGRVTFAEDRLGGAGLRRRRGGVGEKENAGINSNSSSNNNTNMNSMSIMRKAPPKASLLSLSPMMGGDVAGATQANGTDAKGGQDAVAAVRAERSLIPAAHVAPYNPNPYASWVVVYGYANSAQLDTILNRFGTYGTILAHHGGMSGSYGSDSAAADSAAAASASSSAANSNWICLRYETALQAEKAICQHGTFLHGGNPSAGGAGGRNEALLIVGVMRMDAGVARRLGLAGPEGGVAPPRMSGGRPLITGKTTKALLSEEDILLGGSGSGDGSGTLAAGRQGSVCDKVLGWIFMW